ncbi:hypothetical protein BGZ68_005213 [Mortierella alpina]|nr:hypothetical protein BGZ68_005213 [Mortierella alpina]
MTFSSTISIYNALGMNSSFHRMSTAETIANALTIETEDARTPRDTNIRTEDSTGAEAQTAGVSTEPTTEATMEHQVWLIEVSLRECQLDEYVLTVPSPVYSAYRLPTYEDVIGQNRRWASARSSRVAVNRYLGAPPAYNDESDNQSEEDDEDEDGHDDEVQEEREGDERDGSRHLSATSYSTIGPGRQLSPQTQMAMVERRPAELSAVIVISSMVGPPLSPSLLSMSRSPASDQNAGPADIRDSVETNSGSISSTELSSAVDKSS